MNIRPGVCHRFHALPVGTVFSCPDPSNSPLRVKLNENTAGDYPPGPMGPGQPSYHFEGWEYCLVRERRTGPEDRRVTWEPRFAENPNARRANSGRREGDRERYIVRRQAFDRAHRQGVAERRKNPKVRSPVGDRLFRFLRESADKGATHVHIGYGYARELGRICVENQAIWGVGVIEINGRNVVVDYVKRPEFGTYSMEATFPSPTVAEPTTFGEQFFAREAAQAKAVLAQVDSILDAHFGPFRTFGQDAIPRLVQQLVDKRVSIGHELSLQQGRMAAVRSVLKLPIGDPVEAIRDLQARNERQARSIDDRQTTVRGLEAALEAEGRTVARLSDDLRTAEADRTALQDACRLHADDNERLRRELIQTRERMLRERQRYKMAMMGRPTGLGPMAFAQACARKWFTERAGSGRTTRMLDAAIEAMFGDHKRGQKILVCGACGDVDRLVSECERRMRERGYFGLTVRKRMIENAIGGVIRFAVLPPPVQVERVERDLDRGDIFVDHFAVERLFAVLSEIDGRGPATLRLAYPNLAAQLDR